jgi:hypothetical protein
MAQGADPEFKPQYYQRERDREREREREKPGRHHLNYMIRLSSLHDVDARYYGIQIKYHEKSTPQILTPNP